MLGVNHHLFVSFDKKIVEDATQKTMPQTNYIFIIFREKIINAMCSLHNLWRDHAGHADSYLTPGNFFVALTCKTCETVCAE